MINIQPHLDKLEVLKEYMAYRISFINRYVITKTYTLSSGNPVHLWEYLTPITFDEYYNHKQNTV